jgi:hypothetical protein
MQFGTPRKNLLHVACAKLGWQKCTMKGNGLACIETKKNRI